MHVVPIQKESGPNSQINGLTVFVTVFLISFLQKHEATGSKFLKLHLQHVTHMLKKLQ